MLVLPVLIQLKTVLLVLKEKILLIPLHVDVKMVSMKILKKSVYLVTEDVVLVVTLKSVLHVTLNSEELPILLTVLLPKPTGKTKLEKSKNVFSLAKTVLTSPLV